MKNNKVYNMYFTKFPRTRYEKSLNLIWSTLNMVDMHIEQINALLIPIWFRYLGLGILVHLFGSKKYKKLGRFVTMKGDWCTSFRELKWNLNFSKLHSFFLRLWIQLNANPTFFLFRLPWTPHWRISSNFSNLPTIKLITIPTTWDRLVCCLLLELVTKMVLG